MKMMKNKMKMFPALLGLVFIVQLMSGCSLLPTRTEVQYIEKKDPVCEALKNAPEIQKPEKLDLSEYKDLEFILIQNKATGQRTLVAMSYDDFVKFNALLKTLENHIEIQRMTINEIERFLNESLGRQEVDD